MDWRVPLCDLAFDEREEKAVQEVVRSRWMTMGPRTEEFESAFAEFVGSRYAVACSSCTAALHIANVVLGISPGDEVILPSLTFVAGANAVRYVGAQPVFADIESLDRLCISPDAAARLVTPKTKALQVMHYGGHPCLMDGFVALAEEHNLRLIEDCAHAPGAKWKEKCCGTIGDIGCFSFFSNKNMTTAEGGMLVTDDEEVAKRAKKLRSHGMTSLTWARTKGEGFSYDVDGEGYNYRIDEMRAAIGLVQLEKLPDLNARRAETASLYREALTTIGGLQPFFQEEEQESLPSNHIFPVLLDEGVQRLAFMEFLKSKGVQTSIHYPPIHWFTHYRNLLGEIHLPMTEVVGTRLVTLPLYPSLRTVDVEYVVDCIAEFYRREGLAF